MIKSIVFDWGGVISPAGTPDEVGVSLSKILNVSPEEVKLGFNTSAELFKRGKIDETEFWRQLEEYFKVSISISDRNIWTPVEYFKPDPIIFELIRELKSTNFQVSILSNTFPPTATDIKKMGWYDGFEIVILSSDIGYAKPDQEIYEILLDRTKVKPEETLFIDDQEKCLEPAQKIGIKTILAIDTEQIIRDVRSRF